MMKKYSKYIFISALVYVLVGYANKASAVTAFPLNNASSYTDPAEFMKDIYNWGVGIVGLLAFFQFIHGGVLYMISGAVDTKKKAVGIITDAVIGLILAFSSYLIINIINPTLVEVNPISTETAGCFTGDEVTAYLNSGYQCVSSETPDCSDHPETGYFTCSLPQQ